jgi:co-chaperonin GroES (HSP10)
MEATHPIHSKRFRPIGKGVLIRPEPEPSHGEIYIPEVYREDQYGFEGLVSRTAVGVVVAKGPGSNDPDYKYQMDEVELGMRVLYERSAAVKVELDDGTYVVIGVGGCWIALGATSVVTHPAELRDKPPELS